MINYFLYLLVCSNFTHFMLNALANFMFFCRNDLLCVIEFVIIVHLIFLHVPISIIKCSLVCFSHKVVLIVLVNFMCFCINNFFFLVILSLSLLGNDLFFAGSPSFFKFQLLNFYSGSFGTK